MAEHDRLRIFQQILADADAGEPPPGPHWVDDDEMLARWSNGLLSVAESQQNTEHLSRCSVCRKTLVELIRAGVVDLPEAVEDAPDQPTMPRPVQVKSWRSPRLARWAGIGVVATAAVVLAALWLGRTGGNELARAQRDYDAGRFAAAQERVERWLQTDLPDAERADATALLEKAGYATTAKLLEQGRFDEVKQQIDRWSQTWAPSARLRNLRWQAERQIPAEYALAHAGSLLDYGYRLDGSRPFKPLPTIDDRIQEQADNLLRNSGHVVPTLLNLGQYELSLNQYNEADARFHQVLKLDPNNANALNGLGLSAYRRNDFASALGWFEKAAGLDPARVDVRINQAMTLEQLQRVGEARTIWQKLLDEVGDASLKMMLRERLKQ